MVDLFKEIQNAEFREAFNEFDKVLNFLGCGGVATYKLLVRLLVWILDCRYLGELFAEYDSDENKQIFNLILL
jgi:hypothetical protein